MAFVSHAPLFSPIFCLIAIHLSYIETSDTKGLSPYQADLGVRLVLRESLEYFRTNFLHYLYLLLNVEVTLTVLMDDVCKPQ